MLVSDGFFTLLGSRAQLGRTPSAADVAKGRLPCRHQLSTLAITLRGRPGHHRAQRDGRPQPLHHRRRDAARFRFPTQRGLLVSGPPGGHESQRHHPRLQCDRASARRAHPCPGAFRNGKHLRRPGRSVPRGESRPRCARRFHGARHLRKGATGALGVDGRGWPAACSPPVSTRAICCSAAPWTGRAKCACAPRSVPAAAASCGRYSPRGLPIGILGGAAGLVLASYGVSALVVLAPADIPRIAHAQVSGHGVAVHVAALAGRGSGLHAARRAPRLA